MANEKQNECGEEFQIGKLCVCVLEMKRWIEKNEKNLLYFNFE